ncbi:MAG: aconitase family protein [Candidatus Eisenbacteria bacterium]
MNTRRVRPDLLLADRETARVPLGRFASLGLGRVALDCVVARDRPDCSGWSADGPGVTEFLRLAADCGAWLAPPGAGDRSTLALESLAAPGRLFVTLGPAPEAGALGALMLPVGEMEALALLLGEPFETEPARTRRIQLAGELPGRCDGHDVAGALIAAHPGGFTEVWVEVAGEGVGSLSIADRVAICRALSAAGALVVLFPCDDRARGYLRARGRESDWRRTEAGPAPGDAWNFDLGWTVPHAISGLAPTRALPLAWWAGVAVASVDVGPGLGLETLARFAALLRGRSAQAGTTLRVSACSARAATAPEARELAETMTAASARWVREGDLVPWKRRGGRLRLVCGAATGTDRPDEDDWSVGLPAAVEAACRGRIEAPHLWPDSREVESPAGPVIAPPVLPVSRGHAVPSPSTRSASTRMTSRPPSVLRGPVVGRLEGNLEADALLTLGPRLTESLALPEALAEHVVPAARRGGGMLSRAIGSWLLVCGDVRGIERREAALPALAALGVRGVLAAGFEARARTLLARAGMLALRVLRASDLDAVELGDELELVGGLDTFAPDRARVVRDLTRAFAMVALPELNAREWNWVLAGAVPMRRV